MTKQNPLTQAHADQQAMLLIRGEQRDSEHLAKVVTELKDREHGIELPKFLPPKTDD